MTTTTLLMLVTIQACCSLPVLARCQSCTPEKAAYEMSAGRLTIHSKQDALMLTPARLEVLTDETHLFLEQHITHLLQMGKEKPQIEDWLRCIQSSPESEKWREETNTPAVIKMGDQDGLMVVAYWLIRGGKAIPSTRPFVDVYRRVAGDWRYEDSTGEEFTGSTFFVRYLNDKRYGEALVLSGFRIGDPQTPLQIQVLGYSKGLLRTYYKSPLIPQARVISITKDMIVIEQSQTGVGIDFPPLPGVSIASEKRSHEIRSSTLYLSELIGTRE